MYKIEQGHSKNLTAQNKYFDKATITLKLFAQQMFHFTASK